MRGMSVDALRHAWGCVEGWKGSGLMAPRRPHLSQCGARLGHDVLGTWRQVVRAPNDSVNKIK